MTRQILERSFIPSLYCMYIIEPEKKNLPFHAQYSFAANMEGRGSLRSNGRVKKCYVMFVGCCQSALSSGAPVSVTVRSWEVSENSSDGIEFSCGQTLVGRH